MTRADHPTGTDRLAEAALALGLPDDAIVVNVQGDEPLLDPALMRRMAELLAEKPEAAIATACHPIDGIEEAFAHNVVKVVKVVGFVASASGFTGQPGVVNGASELLGEVFGDAGVHARSAVGVAELPINAPVEVEIIVEVTAEASA